MFDFKLWYFVVILLQCKRDTVRENVHAVFEVRQALFDLLKKAWAFDSNHLTNEYYQMIADEFDKRGGDFDKLNKQLKAINAAVKYYEAHGIK